MNIGKESSAIFEQAERVAGKVGSQTSMPRIAKKRKWLECVEKQRPKTIASSLKKCSKDMYPNLSVLLKLAAILRMRRFFRSTTPTNLVKSIHVHKETFVFISH